MEDQISSLLPAPLLLLRTYHKWNNKQSWRRCCTAFCSSHRSAPFWLWRFQQALQCPLQGHLALPGVCTQRPSQRMPEQAFAMRSAWTLVQFSQPWVPLTRYHACLHNHQRKTLAFLFETDAELIQVPTSILDEQILRTELKMTCQVLSLEILSVCPVCSSCAELSFGLGPSGWVLPLC